MSNSDAYLISLMVRSLILGGIVFLSITGIVRDKIVMTNKVLIAVAVVIGYGILEYFGGKATGNLLNKLCNCDDVNDKVAVDTDSISTEVEEAIKILDNKQYKPEAPVLGEVGEEESVKKAMGVSGEDGSLPVPAESSEGFSSW